MKNDDVSMESLDTLFSEIEGMMYQLYCLKRKAGYLPGEIGFDSDIKAEFEKLYQMERGIK
jgi:hypothetical protein